MIEKLYSDFGGVPLLNPKELAWIESKVGRKLTNEEAQEIIRQGTIDAAINYWSSPDRTDPSR
jgi:hypothetical protein